MPLDVRTLAGRKELIKQTEHRGEIGRKYESFKQWEIYQDRMKDFVINELLEQFDEESVKETPIVSSVNLAKRLVDQCAVVYKNEPDRRFTELSDDQVKSVEKLYKHMRVNKKLSVANRGYKLQDQTHLWIVPDMKGGLQLRTLKNHQITVVPSDENPEEAYAYIVSSMDKTDFLDQDNDNLEATGYVGKVDQWEDSADFKERSDEAARQRKKNFIVWTPEYNFSMNEHGDITSELNPNPLAEFGLLPFIDISWEKEFEYWVRQGTGITDFCVQFNTRLSEAAQVVKMQGFAQAILKGPKELLTSKLRVGPNYILKILTDAREGIDGDFQFANPNSDIQGTIAWLESLLSLFLSSRGIDPSSVTTKGEGATYNSGLERLLAMIEKISASSEDFDVFKRAEEKLWRIIAAWVTVLSPTEALKPEFRIGEVSEDSEVHLTFSKPEMVQSENEMLDSASRRIELGLSSAIKEIMDREGVNREQAEEIYDQYQRDQVRITAPEGE